MLGKIKEIKGGEKSSGRKTGSDRYNLILEGVKKPREDEERWGVGPGSGEVVG